MEECNDFLLGSCFCVLMRLTGSPFDEMSSNQISSAGEHQSADGDVPCNGESLK